MAMVPLGRVADLALFAHAARARLLWQVDETNSTGFEVWYDSEVSMQCFPCGAALTLILVHVDTTRRKSSEKITS